MARKKRKSEYALQERWKESGFQLSGVKGVINGETFTERHAALIVSRGLEWKYLTKAGEVSPTGETAAPNED